MMYHKISDLVQKIFLGDMLLNWGLGIILTLFSRRADGILMQKSLFPPTFYLILGVIFLCFALWQTVIFRHKRLTNKTTLIFAAIMSLIPFLILTWALVTFRNHLHDWIEVVLWAGNLYMLLLGAWYLFTAHLLNKYPQD